MTLTMYVITVNPLIRGTHVESLTYYAGVPFEPGTLINAPVRNKLIRAVVVDYEPVSKAKTAIRAATFSLKKLPDQPDVSALPTTLLTTARTLTHTIPAKMGAILFALLPPEVRHGEVSLLESQPTDQSLAAAVSVLQATREERFSSYKRIIREAFAHSGSVVFVVPTSADIAPAVERLARGIEERVVVFSPVESAKRRSAAYAGAHDLTKAKLIITTPSHAYIERHDITHIIVEQSRSRHYQNRVRPFLDHRHALQVLARTAGRALILGDILPRTEDEYARRNDLYQTDGEHPKRLMLPGKLTLVPQTERPTATTPFVLLSKKTVTAIETALSNRRRVFIYAARRGLAPVVACLDCGYIFRCPDSGTPYSLFRTQQNGEEKRWFVSSVSGRRVHAPDVCAQCGSWRLRERGIGIQYIERELQTLFPDTPLTVFDGTTATTPKKARMLIGQHYDEKNGALLLGTTKVLPYLEATHALSVITSLDAARSIPTWRSDEELLGLLLTLREQSEKEVIVQTRTDEPDDLLTLASKGGVSAFYDGELELRETLSYPPFAFFIHLSWTGQAEPVAAIETQLTELLSAYTPHFFSAPQSTREKTTRYCLLRIPRDAWPDTELMNTLRTLPPNVQIEVNPYRII